MRVIKDKRGWLYDFYFGSHITKNGKKVPTRYQVHTGLGKADTKRAMLERLERLRKERHGLIDSEAPERVPFKSLAGDFIELHAKQNKRRWARHPFR